MAGKTLFCINDASDFHLSKGTCFELSSNLEREPGGSMLKWGFYRCCRLKRILFVLFCAYIGPIMTRALSALHPLQSQGQVDVLQQHPAQIRAKEDLLKHARQAGFTTSDGDGHGGDGFVVEPLVRNNLATVIVFHGLGGNGEEVSKRRARKNRSTRPSSCTSLMHYQMQA